MNRIIGNTSNYLAAVFLLVMGLVYFFSNHFMPYHSAAVEMPWKEVDNSFQYLILALMRAVAGGFLSAAVFVFVLQRKFSRTRLPWIPLLILVPGLVLSGASIYATLIIRFHTPGKPPTALAIAGIVLLLIAYIFNMRSLKKD